MVNWKVIAIILFTILVIENIFFMWSVMFVLNEEGKINECYYNICSEYADADYSENVCFCYDYDDLGYLVLEKTELMK